MATLFLGSVFGVGFGVGKYAFLIIIFDAFLFIKIESGVNRSTVEAVSGEAGIKPFLRPQKLDHDEREFFSLEGTWNQLMDA